MIWYYIKFLISTDINNSELCRQNEGNIRQFDLSLENREEIQNKRIKLHHQNPNYPEYEFQESQINLIYLSLDEIYIKSKQKKFINYSFVNTTFSILITDKWYEFLKFAIKHLRNKNINLLLNPPTIQLVKRFRCRYNRYNNNSRKRFITCYENLKKVLMICQDLRYDHINQITSFASQLYYLYPIGTLNGFSYLSTEKLVLRMLFLETILTKLYEGISMLELHNPFKLEYEEKISVEYKLAIQNMKHDMFLLKNNGIRILRGLNIIGIENKNQIPDAIYKYLTDLKLFN